MTVAYVKRSSLGSPRSPVIAAIDIGERDLPNLLQWRCGQDPQATIVRFGTVTLCASDFEGRVARLAAVLRDAGVEAGAFVGLCVDRNLDMPVAWHAIQRAGGAVVPLDPAYPADRLAYVLSDSGAALVLGHRARLDELPAGDAQLLAIEDVLVDDEDVSDETHMEPLPPDPDRPAYVIYTSGSTGRPKGVIISHRSLTLLIRTQVPVYSCEELEVFSGAVSLSFDLCIPEMTMPFATPGASLRILTNALALAGPGAPTDITLFHTVPSVLAELLRLGGLPKSIRTVTLCGEPLTRQTAEQAFGVHPGLRLRNLYGPTEATVYVTGEDVIPGEDGPPSIGFAFDGVDIHIVDDKLQPLPDGEWGELGIAGDWLAVGYHNRPDLNAERFASVDWAKGGRLYRTGDFARLRPDGRYEVTGRLDNQVKVRGFRVELEEVENVLTNLPGVGQACVVLVGEDSAARLIAFVTGDGSGLELSPRALRSGAQTALPAYMVPSLVTVEDSLPQLPNGKTDRNGLKARASSNVQRQTAGEEPVNYDDSVTGSVTRLMAEVLNLNSAIGEDDSFFDIGGTSLLGVQLLVEIDRYFGVDLPLQTLMTATTPAELSAVLSDAGATVPAAFAVLREGTGNPIFLLAGWFGQFLNYRTLAVDIETDRPVIGICPQTRTESWSLTNSMPELAARAVSIIQELQPEGPYLLGGHSFGGMLAYEAASHLQLAGQQLESLLLLDSGAPIRGTRRAVIELRRLLKGSVNLTELRARLASRAVPAPVVEQPQSNTSGGINPSWSTQDTSLLADIEGIDTANQQAMRGWHPLPLAVDALLIRTQEWSEQLGDPLLGLGRLVHGRLLPVDVGGGHLTVLKSEWVSVVAQSVTDWINPS
jgi:enterobactin synthetase component F